MAESFPFNQAAVELHSYSLWSEDILRGKGLYPYGVGYGEKAEGQSRRAGAFFNDPPWVDPPPGSKHFERAGVRSNPGASPSQNFVQISNAVYRVPKGFTAVVWQLGANDIQDGTTFQNGSAAIFWRLQIDRRPVDGFSEVILEVGTRDGNPRRFNREGIFVFEQQTIEWLVWNVSGPPGDRISAFIGGMIYPIQGR